MFGSIGFPELVMIFAVILIIFGPQKLPEFAKMLGKFIREFKSTVDEAKSTIEREIEQADVREDLRKVEMKLKEELVEPIYPPVLDLPRPAPEARPADAADSSPEKPADHEEKSG